MDKALLISPVQAPENPFFTQEGQTPVSVTETFWERLARHGRLLNQFSGGTTGTFVTAGNWGYGSAITPSPGHRFYPKCATISTDQLAYIQIQAITSIPYLGAGGNAAGNGTMYWNSYVSPGQPFTMDFDGEVWIEDGGQFAVNCFAINSNVHFHYGIHGIEVIADVQP